MDVLRDAGRLSVSLVAEVDGVVVGHVAFSPVSAGAAIGSGLAPVAVLPGSRRRGIAAQLIREGLAACERAGSGFAVVLGEPGYYARFGFRPASGWGLSDEYGGGAAFQAIELRAGAVPVGAGLVRYAPEFASLGGDPLPTSDGDGPDPPRRLPRSPRLLPAGRPDGLGRRGAETGMLWLRTLLFTLLVPGSVLVLVPIALLASGVGSTLRLGPARWVGLPPLVLGLAIILWCFAEFIRRGRGTPAPYDPPRKLVSAGLYRFVRNPQYVGVLLVAVGEALLAEASILVGYAACLAIAYHLLVRYYEEPTLGRLFGNSYARYRDAVPRWLPRWRS